MKWEVGEEALIQWKIAQVPSWHCTLPCIVLEVKEKCITVKLVPNHWAVQFTMAEMVRDGLKPEMPTWYFDPLTGEQLAGTKYKHDAKLLKAYTPKNN